MVVEVIGASSDGLMELSEVEAEGEIDVGINGGLDASSATWRVQRSAGASLPEGMLVSIYDTTPSAEPPPTAEGGESEKYLRLQASEADAGSLTYDGIGGMSLEGCPRELDGVSFAFTVWSCRGGAEGRCSVVEEGEDPEALICEFGPKVLKEGLKTMIPGESRRFWVPANVEDRRFGRPPPDSYLPGGSLVVDVTLRTISREAVFNYKMSAEARKISDEKESSPGRILMRALGVGVQVVPWAWFYFQAQQQQAGAFLDPPV